MTGSFLVGNTIDRLDSRWSVQIQSVFPQKTSDVSSCVSSFTHLTLPNSTFNQHVSAHLAPVPTATFNTVVTLTPFCFCLCFSLSSSPSSQWTIPRWCSALVGKTFQCLFVEAHLWPLSPITIQLCSQHTAARTPTQGPFPALQVHAHYPFWHVMHLRQALHWSSLPLPQDVPWWTFQIFIHGWAVPVATAGLRWLPLSHVDPAQPDDWNRLSFLLGLPHL